MKNAYVIKDEIVVQVIDNKIVLLNPETSKLHTLNNTASFILQKLQKNVPLEQIEEMVKRKFDVSQEIARKDTNQFIGTLKKNGILMF